MFKTKRDVDRHVSHLLNKIRVEKERNARGFHIAKLYYDVSDYDSAKRYLQAFLSVREASPQAHKLLGQIHEAQKDKNKAIEAYKRSLDLEPDQNDLVLKVCDLYSDPSVTVNADSAKFWIERAEKLYPNHYTIFKLKERVVDTDGSGDNTELEHLISTELLKNPKDVHLHIKLLRLLIQSSEVTRAYEHAVKTEKTLAFTSSIDWYECITDVYQVYKDQQNGGGDDQIFYTYKLFALATLTFLRLQAEDRDMLSVVKSLHQLDQDLYEANNIQRQNMEWDNFLTEMKGQLFFLIAVFLLKRSLKGQVPWKDATSFSAVCFLISDSLPAVDQKSRWIHQVSPDRKKFYERLYMTGCDRLSQGGHVIYSLLSKQDGSLWARKLRQRLCTPQGKESLFSLVFTGADQRRHKDTSFLVNSDIFTGTNLDIPAKSQLLKYDGAAYSLHSNNLNHLVWLALRYHTLKDDVQSDYEQLFGTQLFPEMKYSVSDLSGGDPGSMCQLDIQVFLYTCVRWVSTNQRDLKRNLHPITDKPDLLPVCLSSSLCTPQQCEWWSAVYRMENKVASEKLSKLWGVVMRGLETIRLISPRTLPLPLIVHVARTLETRGREIESLDAEGIVTPKLSSMQGRAAYYWGMASDMIARLDRNQGVKQPKEMLFPGSGMIDPGIMKEVREQVKFAMATVAMREEKYEEAVQAFENLYQPEASYYTGLIYRKLAENLNSNSNSSVRSENSQQLALLSKSKNSLYQALDRLETEPNEELKESVRRDLDDVVCKLISVESGGNLVDSLVSNGSGNYSTAESDVESEEDLVIKQPSPQRQGQKITPILQTPTRGREILRPSPTRVDVQMRALESTNTALSSRITSLEDTVRNDSKHVQELFTQLREIRDQLRESRDENRTLREQVQILSFQGLSNMSLSRQPLPQTFPGTPQPLPQAYPGTPQAPRNVMNTSFGAGIPLDYTGGQAAIPPHMSQYGYPAASPRPQSAYAPQNYDDDFHNVDGEYYDPDVDPEYYVPDQNLVQVWPFGHKAGVEGKSTITYSPQPQGRSPNPTNPAAAVTNPGVYAANALRGQAIQYGGYQQANMAPQAPQMPGPGFFSQNNQQMAPSASPVLFQGQGQQHPAGVMPGKPGANTSTVTISTPQQKTPSIASPGQPNSKPSTPMMPPNAIASPSTEAKPKLIPGSVGVPTPKKGEKPKAQSVLAGNGLLSTPSNMLSAGTGALTTSVLAETLSSSSGQGQVTPGSAASMLSQLAAKHTEDSKPGQGSTTPASVAQTTPQKTVFKGFSFTSTPKISEPKADNKEVTNIKAAVTTTASAPKPFGGFSFTTPTSQTPAGVSASPFGSGPRMTNTTGSLFAQNHGSPMSFAGLATQGQSSFQAGGDTKGFSGAGQPLFGKSPSPRRRNVSVGSDDHVDEYEPNVDFKPVVPLPDLIEVKTGEEDEEKMFCERAKLFRYDLEAKQWKERGIGEIKILQHQETKKVRILMRREQVLKLCANHKITKDMKLTPLASSDKAWVWNAMDFSEEKVKPEKFAIRFKNADIAQKFKERFEQSQAEMVDSIAEVKKPDNKEKDKPATSTASSDSAGKSGFAGLFKQKEGSWTCDGCYIQNNGDILSCPCCNTLKPGVKKEDLPQTTKLTSTMTMASGGGFKFGSQPTDQGSVTTESGFKLPATGKPETGSGFKFGAQPSDAASSSSSPAQSAGFKFGTPTSTSVASNLFGTKPKTTETSVTAPSGSGGFKFGNSATSTDVKSSTSSPFGTPSSGSGGFKFGTSTTSTAEKSEVKSAAPSEGKDGLFGLPEPCKPSSGFVFGGSATTSSAGFNVNKDESKYPFGTPKSTETVAGESASKSDDTTEGNGERKPGESLLAQFLASPDSWKCDGCLVSNDGSILKCQCCGNMKPANSGTNTKTGKLSFGSGLAAKSTFSFGQSTGDTTVEDTANSGLIFGSTNTENKMTGGFNFGAASGTTPTKSVEPFKFMVQPTSETPTKQPAASLGSGFNFSMNMTPTKPGVKSPLKSPGIKSPGIKSPGGNEDEYYQEEDDSHIHFEPVIDLPDKVEVKTGEEDEEVMFVHRAKLFRFDKNEWKERGLGEVKVLYNVDTNKARIVMRREQILKLCCNHYVSDDIKLKPMPNSKGCALVWYAMDCADGEPRNTQLSIKFKNADVANDFESAVEKAKARISGESGQVVETKRSSAPQMGNIGDNDDVMFVGEDVATDEEIESARALMLPDHFYVYERLPPCPGCRGCTDTMPGEEEERNTGRDNETDGQTEIQDDDHDDNDDDDDSYEDDEDDYEDDDEDDGSEEEVKEVRMSATKEVHLGDKGNPMYSEQLDKVGELGSSDTGGGFVFGSSANTGSFSALAAASGSSGAFSADESKPFHWQGAGKPLFGGRVGPRGEDGGSGDEGDNVQQGDDPHFEPIVPLPDLVEVKTGEEDETLEYNHRAKLYRYDKTTNQWKEKGVGEMKILKHKETGKYRLLLRREQVHKLVCNHLLTPDLILTPMNTSETSWCWTAQDFSEDEPKVEQLAIKLKTIELAKTFKDKFEEIQAILKGE